jgi:serine/threonine protein kinase
MHQISDAKPESMYNRGTVTDIGEVLAGKYRLERLIGSGGFAAVYAAKNVLIDRPVALKMLHSTVAQNKVVVERFLREARLASKNIHPTIVRVEDIGQHQRGEPYLIMELLEGRNLADEMEDKGAMPLPKALSVATYMLEGLAAAHKQGIIHRDFKPANIFLVAPGFPDPPVRILDLGMAKDLREQHLLTVSGDVIGTPSYLAPEILLHPSDTLWIPALDVYSMGMMLFYMLTGRLPFTQGENESGYMAVLNRMDFYKSVTSLQGPAEFAPHVPPPIDTVVRRALSILPEGRYRDAQEMLDALNQAKTNIGPRMVRSARPPPVRSFSFDSDVEELDDEEFFDESLDFDSNDDDEATKQWTTAELMEAMNRMDSSPPGSSVGALRRRGAPRPRPRPAPPTSSPAPPLAAHSQPAPPFARPTPSTPTNPRPSLQVVPSMSVDTSSNTPEAPRHAVKAKPRRGQPQKQPFDNRPYIAATVLMIILILAAVGLLVARWLSWLNFHPMVPALLGGWAGLSSMSLLITVLLWVMARRRG